MLDPETHTYNARDLTVDQNPDSPGEKERILKVGERVGLVFSLSWSSWTSWPSWACLTWWKKWILAVGGVGLVRWLRALASCTRDLSRLLLQPSPKSAYLK